MEQRGVTLEEIERTLNEGWDATDAKPGTFGKVFLIVLSGWDSSMKKRKSPFTTNRPSVALFC